MLSMIFIIVEQSLLHMPFIIGAYISCSLLKVPDLSIESAYVTGAIFGSYALGIVSLPLYVVLFVALTASFCGGAIVGLVSSSITRAGRLSHLLSTIITGGLFHGINQLLSPAYRSLNTLENPLRLFEWYSTRYSELPMVMLINLIVVVAIALLFKTQIGYAYAVYGKNNRFFSAYGISTSFVFVTGVMLANGLAGVSGYLFAQSNNFVELNMGFGKVLLAIAALVLGKALVRSEKPYTILMPIGGSVFYFACQQLLLKVGFNLKYFTAAQAAIVLCLLVFGYRNRSKRSSEGLGV